MKLSPNVAVMTDLITFTISVTLTAPDKTLPGP